MASPRLSATKIGVGALIALTLATAVATVVSLQGERANSVPTAIATSPAESNLTRNADAHYAIDLLSGLHNSTGSFTREKTFADLLPNHTFFVGSSDPVALASGIVIGDVASVEPGAAYSVDAITNVGTAVDFRDKKATSRDLIVTVTVESALGEVSGESAVQFGIAVDGSADIDQVIAGFRDLGRIIAVLEAPGKLTFEPDLYSIRQGGGLIGLVAADGSFSFPSLGSDNDQFLAGIDTVTDVLTEGTGPDVISKVERAGSSPSED